MKPDGTYTVDEILQICNDQLQSWERDRICKELLKDISDIELYELFSRHTPEYISTITGYFVCKEKPESEIEDFTTSDLIDELYYRLLFYSITLEQKELLKKMAETAKTF